MWARDLERWDSDLREAGRGGFPLVLGTTAFVALAFLIAVVAIAFIAANVERDRVPHAMPAE